MVNFALLYHAKMSPTAPLQSQCLHLGLVIYFKLYLELDGWSYISIGVVIFTLIIYLMILSFLSANTVLAPFIEDGEMRGISNHAIFQKHTFLIISIVPILVVMPDYMFKSVIILNNFFRHQKHEGIDVQMTKDNKDQSDRRSQLERRTGGQIKSYEDLTITKSKSMSLVNRMQGALHMSLI